MKHATNFLIEVRQGRLSPAQMMQVIVILREMLTVASEFMQDRGINIKLDLSEHGPLAQTDALVQFLKDESEARDARLREHLGAEVFDELMRLKNAVKDRERKDKDEPIIMAPIAEA